MSSTNSTYYLGLNKWRGSDVPEMDDFNRDNIIVDNAVGMHNANTDIHITAAERAKWNSVYCVFTFLGNGAANRSVEIPGSFEPSWGMIFASGKVPSVTDFGNTSDYNYFAVVTQQGSMPGVSLSGGNLNVQQSAAAILGSEYKSFNEVGTTYVCIVFA